MRVRVRFFAGTRDAVGAPALDVDVPEAASVRDVVARVERDHPRLAAYRDVALLALDGAFVPAATRVREGAEIAVMPPVSGGAGRLQGAPLDVAAIPLRTEGAGAVVTFLGLVRGPASALRFEAYDEMAERELARVRDEAIAKFSLVDCEIRHRVAELKPGEPIVAVLVAARHRREAFEAAAWVMDELKARVPIWKQEGGRWVNDPTT
jgi:molybdopterin synthase catalytic subunit